MATYQLFREQAEIIDAVLTQICRGRRLTVDICEEFSSWVRLRLLEGDSAILRKFAGRSSPRTFLMTVIKRLYLDWRNKEWGKWRPSTAARRQGTVAIELERLVLRDRLPFDEAVEHLVFARHRRIARRMRDDLGRAAAASLTSSRVRRGARAHAGVAGAGFRDG